MPCRLSTAERSGWEALVLENECLRVVVLPEKGADIYELVDLRTGVDVLFKAPWGLQPPGSPPREGTGGAPFLQNYEGGWQELFPSAGDPCRYGDRPVAFHGEVATSGWTAHADLDSDDEVALELSVRCQNPAVGLRRVMRLRAGSPALVLEERVDNDGVSVADFVWGHHCVLGPPFVEEGCRLDIPATTIMTPSESWEETARLEPGQRSAWPFGVSKSGEPVDLSRVPAPDTGSHDDVFITGLTEGRVAVSNARLDLAFVMTFDPGVFPWIVSWQPFGGAQAMPLAGSYALGIEPWTSRLNLEDALAAGEAVTLEPGEVFETRLSVRLDSASRAASGVPAELARADGGR